MMQLDAWNAISPRRRKTSPATATPNTGENVVSTLAFVTEPCVYVAGKKIFHFSVGPYILLHPATAHKPPLYVLLLFRELDCSSIASHCTLQGQSTSKKKTLWLVKP